jgi:hypothetical protein
MNITIHTLTREYRMRQQYTHRDAWSVYGRRTSCWHVIRSVTFKRQLSGCCGNLRDNWGQQSILRELSGNSIFRRGIDHPSLQTSYNLASICRDS